MKNNNLLLGIISGVAIGSILGVLFAPAKGSETRKKIRDKGSDLKDNFKNSVSKLSEKIDGYKSDATILIEEEKANLENLKDINKASLL